jgi:hypothetical protein
MGGMRPVQQMSQAGGSSSDMDSSGGAQKAGGSSRRDNSEPESPRSKKRRELYETGEAINKTLRPSETVIPTTTKSQPPIEYVDDEELLSSIDPIPTSTLPSSAFDPLSSALDNVSNSLALTLDRLASSLAAHRAGTDSSTEARYFIDVKLHTEALKDVLDCVGTIRGMK